MEVRPRLPDRLTIAKAAKVHDRVRFGDGCGAAGDLAVGRGRASSGVVERGNA